jgi:hypothetical protein
LTGWKVTYSDDDTVQLGDGGPIQLGFQRVDGYQPPGWPDPAKQAHLDVGVADLADGGAQGVGARGHPAGLPARGDDWAVLIDPPGHPFCLHSRLIVHRGLT